MPSVLGEVLPGMLIGPSLLGLIEPERTSGTFWPRSEFCCCLFEVGLETDVGRIIKVGVQSLLVAATGVVVPCLSGFYVAYAHF